MPGTHQNVQSLGASGLYGTYTNYGGGGVPVARSELDYLRMGVGREPSAEYPDGYLGTIRSRRDDRGLANGTSDRVLDKMKQRVGQRSYQRGVHRGERIDPSDYYYPSGLDRDRGIKRQMAAARRGDLVPRNAPVSKLAPAPHLVNDGKANTKHNAPYEVNQRRVDQISRLKPAWQ
jgi:hypothetical protein